MAALPGQLIGHLIKRRLDATDGNMPLPAMSMEMDRDDLMGSQQEQWNRLMENLPLGGAALVAVTGVAFYFILIGLTYTIYRVVMTLAMIETPTIDYIPIAALDNLDPNTKSDPELMINGEPHLVQRNRPVTSSIRSTVRMLTAQFGATARLRGLGYALVYTLSSAVVYNIFNLFLSWLPAGGVFASIITAVITAQFHCAWTHKMISASNGKGFRARLLGFGIWRQLWIPNAVASALAHASVLLVFMVGTIFVNSAIKEGDNKRPDSIKDSWVIIVLKAVGLVGLAFFLGFFIVLPAYAALTRIEATLLPDEEDTVVPFDRTFDGKVTPVVVGGSGLKYVREVCKTFDREARLRIIKLFFKGMGILFAVIIVAVHVLGLEVFVIGLCSRGKAKQASTSIIG